MNKNEITKQKILNFIWRSPFPPRLGEISFAVYGVQNGRYTSPLIKQLVDEGLIVKTRVNPITGEPFEFKTVRYYSAGKVFSNESVERKRFKCPECLASVVQCIKEEIENSRCVCPWCGNGWNV